VRNELLTTRQQLAAATSAASGPPPGPGAAIGPGAPSQILSSATLVAGGAPYPPGSEPPYSRDYPRDRPVERDPRGTERSGLGPLGVERGIVPSSDRERGERERLERERDRERLERERERTGDSRDQKRIKNDRIKNSGEFLQPSGSLSSASMINLCRVPPRHIQPVSP